MSDEAVEPEDDAGEQAPPPPETAYGALVTWSGRQRVLHPAVDAYIETLTALRDDDYVSLLDLCGVDYLTHPGRTTLPDGVDPERFELVVTLMSHREAQRVRLRVQVPADNPVVPTAFDLYPGSEAFERETYDMFGIEFDNLPDPTRILMPADWEGHPLRKDFAVGSVPVQFKGAPAAR